jgi:predicted nucleic acid-binding protein
MAVATFSGISRLGIDTSPFIYFVEANPIYDAVVSVIFQRIADGTLFGVTSVITLTEVLNHPIRLGHQKLEMQYRSLLTNSRNLDLVTIDSPVATLAAELRARYNLRTPDALQVSASLQAGCQGFLTNDKGLKRVAELQVIVLDELLTA